MIKSMTGFGKATKIISNKKITVEIKTLNSKSADISLRLPSSFRNFDLKLRNDLSQKLERGKIDFSLNIETNQKETQLQINLETAMAYYQQLSAIAKELNETQNLLPLILKMPDIYKNDNSEIEESILADINLCIDEAIAELNKFREEEGKSLQNDFDTRLKNIFSHIEEIKKQDPERMTNVSKKLKNNLNELINSDKIDTNRFEQELIYYIEKFDINEEIVRLTTHLNYFMDCSNEISSGRKLGFICQEIGREINTIGSKANDATMQKLVVQMKDELEKMKEQVNNVL